MVEPKFLFSEILDPTTSEKYSRSGRKLTPNKSHSDFYLSGSHTKVTPSKAKSHKSNGSNDSDSSPEQDELMEPVGIAAATKDFMKNDVAGSEIFQFSTPKKSDGMKRKAENTPKSPATALSRLSLNSPKTPRIIPAVLRTQNMATPTATRNQIKKVLKQKARHHIDESESESSADEHSDYEAEESDDSDSTSDDENANAEATASDDDDDFEQPATKRNAPSKQKPVELPATRTRGRPKKKSNEDDFIPDSDNYFLTAANKKVILNRIESITKCLRFFMRSPQF